MVKFNKILTIFGFSTLYTFAYANECDEFKFSGVSVRECDVDENQQMVYLKITGKKVTQELVDKIATYNKLSELQFYKFDDYSDVNLGSLNIPTLEFNYVRTGPRANKYSGNVVPEEVIRTINKIDQVNITGYKITQGTIDSLATLNNVKEMIMTNGGFDEGLDFLGLKNTKNLSLLHLHNYTKGPELGVFPESLCQLNNLKSLKVQSKLTSIPKCISNLQNLETLNLAYNYLTELPQEIGDLKNLKILDLYYDQFTTVPSFINKLSNLEQLVLTNNKLTAISSSVCELKNLQELEVNFSTVASIPSCINKLSNLKRLDLRSNKITSIPSGLFKLKNLESLDLGNNSISTISSNIKNLKNLKLLYLFNNNISTIPNNISQLTNLIKLNFSENKITKIPTSISKLKNLEELGLAYNKITDIPAFLSQLTKLQKLDLSNNSINAVIPESLNNLSELTTIYLSGNVEVKGKTLTNPKLKSCDYENKNSSIISICVAKNTVCIPWQGYPDC